MIDGSEERKRQLPLKLTKFQSFGQLPQIGCPANNLSVPSIHHSLSRSRDCELQRAFSIRKCANAFKRVHGGPYKCFDTFLVADLFFNDFSRLFFFWRESISIKTDSRNLSQRITAKFFTGRDILQKVGSSLALNSQQIFMTPVKFFFFHITN